METINDRVRILRKHLKQKQSEFGNKIDTSQNYLSQIEKGDRPVTEKITRLICLQSWNGKYINELWLREGKGDMFLELPPEDEVAAAVSEVLEDIDNENPSYTLVKEFLLKYEKLDDNTQKIVDNFITDVVSSFQEKFKDKRED